MKRKLFLSTFLASILVFVSCFVLLLGVLYGYFSRQQMDELKNKAALLAQATNQYGDEFLLQSDPGSSTRTTLIDSDGTVLYDSLYDPSALDNHGDREEIRQAMESGSGQSNRYSSTFAERSNNYAIKLSDGRILRLSDTLYTPLTLFKSAFPLTVLILIMAVFLSLLLSARVAQSIIAPINSINLTSPDKEAIYPELMPLVDRINDQRRQLDIQVEELTMEHERQDRLRREFTANVSHELKTPLTSISGYAEIMKNGMVDSKNVTLFSGRIYSESRRLITLVEDIIKLSQLEEKDIHIPLTEIDLYDAAAAVLDHLAPVAENNSITLHLTGDHCRITGAHQIIDEMINNLCDNAIKYNNPGGKVTVTIFQTAKDIRLSVADTGIGIPEEGIDRVFERFYRMDKSHSKAVGGTGLGLSIVKHGAAYHNAQIVCSSKVGVGTNITIVFPLIQAQTK